jgi:hypothetical protein
MFRRDLHRCSTLRVLVNAWLSREAKPYHCQHSTTTLRMRVERGRYFCFRRHDGPPKDMGCCCNGEIRLNGDLCLQLESLESRLGSFTYIETLYTTVIHVILLCPQPKRFIRVYPNPADCKRERKSIIYDEEYKVPYDS